ncbi:MAG: site-2 protease family protein [Desulfuromonas sp.]|nr:MAG: site-2 protease family protein [Desulfuromonas sp.]
MESILSKISIMLVPALLAVTVHEVSHGYIADKLGDPTARLLGRLTFNPIKHLDPIGTLAVLFFGFGWAKPVPVNFGNMQQPKKGMIAVALAGPASNLFLAGLFALLLHGLALIPEDRVSTQMTMIVEPISLMAGFGLYINIILAVFNMIPIPPLDGGMVLSGLLPPKQAAFLSKIEPFGFIVLLIVIFYTNIWSAVLGPIIFAIVGVMAGQQAVVVNQSMRFLFGSM